MTQELDDTRQDRYDDNSEYHQGEVLFDRGDIAKKVASKDENGDPGDAGRDIIDHETPVGHKTETSHKRCKGSDDRNESGYDNCLPSMLFIEPVGPFQIFSVQETDIFLVEYLRPDIITDPVIHCVASNSGDAEKTEQPSYFQGTAGRQCSRCKEKRITREKRGHHQACFAKMMRKRSA